MASSQSYLLSSFPSSPRLLPPNLTPSPLSRIVAKTQSLTATTTHRRHRNPPSLTAIQTDEANNHHHDDILRGTTRTVSTLIATAILLLKLFRNNIPSLVNFTAPTASAASALLFASLKSRPSGYLNTPLTVVAAGLGKWLDIYSGVLMVRVLLSWFPNIPWERQPLSAIRDLCDPYLNLFRNIIPPVFDTLDVSPLLAFAVLGTLGSILNTAMV
ncbi:hypothetical protein RIF29_39959 [Crotalaria pallida]|uniref:Uncharacterized protein n=1 Tax=Crotalaria pallida TaxID=3830 RepID=A0AAN9E7N4_CROPI